jgi:hypothetical protein
MLWLLLMVVVIRVIIFEVVFYFSTVAAKELIWVVAWLTCTGEIRIANRRSVNLLLWINVFMTFLSLFRKMPKLAKIVDFCNLAVSNFNTYNSRVCERSRWKYVANCKTKDRKTMWSVATHSTVHNKQSDKLAVVTCLARFLFERCRKSGLFFPLKCSLCTCTGIKRSLVICVAHSGWWRISWAHAFCLSLIAYLPCCACYRISL